MTIGQREFAFGFCGSTGSLAAAGIRALQHSCCCCCCHEDIEPEIDYDFNLEMNQHRSFDMHVWSLFSVWY